MGSKPIPYPGAHVTGADPTTGRIPVTLVAIRKYFQERAQTTRLSDDVRAWFADAAAVIERLESSSEI